MSTVSKRLGHAKTSANMDIYSHILQKSDTAADTLEDLFNKKDQNNKQE